MLFGGGGRNRIIKTSVTLTPLFKMCSLKNKLRIFVTKCPDVHMLCVTIDKYITDEVYHNMSGTF